MDSGTPPAGSDDVGALGAVQRAWGLTDAELAACFSVTADEVARWHLDGVPARHAVALDELVEVTELLRRHLKADRVPAVVRRPADGLGGRSLVEVAMSGDMVMLLERVREMFTWPESS